MSELTDFGIDELYFRAMTRMVDRTSVRIPPVTGIRIPAGVLRGAVPGAGTDVRVIVIGDDTIAAKLRTLYPAIVRSEIFKAAKDISDIMYDQIIPHVPVGATGSLIGGIFVEARAPLRAAVQVAYGVEGPAEAYWQPVETGTGVYGPFKRPYTVRKRFSARRLAGGPLLRRPARAGQQWKLMSQFYMHPGMAARPYFGPGLSQAAPLVRARAKQVTSRIVARIKLSQGG